jgi:hypothetical protein
MERRMGKPWKQSEREIAKMMGDFRRRANDGFGSPDIVAGPWAVEVKTRKALPDWFKEAHAQAKRNAGSLTPLVVFAERTQGKKTERFVSMRMEDWLEWYGPDGWARTICGGTKA